MAYWILPAFLLTLGAGPAQLGVIEGVGVLAADPGGHFEAVAAAAPAVADLVSGARRAAVLVASRERLRVAGEREYPLRPLAEAPAVELFRQRAAAVVPDYEGDYTQLAKLCRQLDGLPLAIELAAARLKLLTADELLRRLEQRLPLLRGGRRDAPARHQTLRATIDWSYALLEAREQELFARLAVFAGSFSVAAAETVCDADVDTLASLVDKSLVQRMNARFVMLATIREYALERLVERSEERVSALSAGSAVVVYPRAECLGRGGFVPGL